MTWTLLNWILHFLVAVCVLALAIAIGALLRMGWQLGGYLLGRWNEWRDSRPTSSWRR